MQTLPIFLDVQGKRCLLVGESEVAQRKRRLLVSAGAVVDVVAADLFTDTCLDGVSLVVSACEQSAVNERVSTAAKARFLPVNVVDRPELCTFIFPSVIDRNPIVIAVSSNGVAPVLARLLRARLEALLPATLGEFAQRIAVLRSRVASRLPDMRQRLRFWDHLLQPYLLGTSNALSALPEESELLAHLESFAAHPVVHGHVAILGDGTGEPDLLSFRALRYLQACDRLVVMAGVNDAVVSLSRRDAERQDVTKADDIMAILQAGIANKEKVVFLVTGDPMAWSEMSTWLMHLQAQAISYEVVPSVMDMTGGGFHGI